MKRSAQAGRITRVRMFRVGEVWHRTILRVATSSWYAGNRRSHPTCLNLGGKDDGAVRIKCGEDASTSSGRQSFEDFHESDEKDTRNNLWMSCDACSRAPTGLLRGGAPS
jgi:hypothetical protein